MIIIKTSDEILRMKKACKIAAKALALAGKAVHPGVNTQQIDDLVSEFITKEGAKCSFLGYGGFPKNTCISVNDVVVHGIPSKSVVLKKGDIVSIDIGAFYEGFHGDNAATFACGEILETAQSLIDATKNSLYEGIKRAQSGARVGDIGSAVESYVKSCGYFVVKDFVGHGVGEKLHEDPAVPNYGKSGMGARLLPGMTIAIEPMVNEKDYRVKTLEDGWTTTTLDGGLSAHFEHTIAITESGPMILTECEY